MANIRTMKLKSAVRNFMLVVAIGAATGIFAYSLLGGVGVAMGGSAVGLRGSSFMLAGALLTSLFYCAYLFGRSSRKPDQSGRPTSRN